MTEPESEPKEPTPLEKLQAEYNQLVARLGHNIAQMMNLKAEEETLRFQIQKVTKKAANIAKPKPEPMTEEEVVEAIAATEAQNGTNG